MNIPSPPIEEVCGIAEQTIRDFLADVKNIQDVKKDAALSDETRKAIVTQYVDRNHERIATLNLQIQRMAEELPRVVKS